eukprot:TRINITY_DN1655_c0_g1_i1.p1 TRINITY_DN1655_c0_g1~~TRINITY_DN1655_c0_g1_i1.p1  ORF type:complete len:795 (+),score=233.29 TRINITY_DN1655_c0_g1_i1:77-2386(+)
MLPCFTEDLRVLEQMVTSRMAVEERFRSLPKEIEDPPESPEVMSVSGDDAEGDAEEGTAKGSAASGRSSEGASRKSSVPGSIVGSASGGAGRRDVFRPTHASLAKNKKWQQEQEAAFIAAEMESEMAGRPKVTAERKEEALEALKLWSLRGAETNVKRTKDYLAKRAAASLQPQHKNQYNQLKKLVKPGAEADSLLRLPKHPHEEQPDFLTVGLQTVQRYHYNKDSTEAAGTPPTTKQYATVKADRQEEALDAMVGWYQKGAEALAKKTKAEVEERLDPWNRMMEPGRQAGNTAVKKLVVPTGREETEPMFAEYPPHPQKDVGDFQSAISGTDIHKQHVATDTSLMNPLPKGVKKTVTPARHEAAVEAMQEWSKKGAATVGKSTKQFVLERVGEISSPDYVTRYERAKKLCDPTSEDGAPMLKDLPPHPFADKSRYSPVVRNETVFKKQRAEDVSLVAPPRAPEKKTVTPARHEHAVEAMHAWAAKGSSLLGEKTKEHIVRREMDAMAAREEHMFSGQVKKYALLRKLIRPGDPDNPDPGPMLDLPAPDEAGATAPFSAMVGKKTLQKQYEALDKALYMKEPKKEYSVEQMIAQGRNPPPVRIAAQKPIDEVVYERLCRHEASERRRRSFISPRQACSADPPQSPDAQTTRAPPTPPHLPLSTGTEQTPLAGVDSAASTTPAPPHTPTTPEQLLSPQPPPAPTPPPEPSLELYATPEPVGADQTTDVTGEQRPAATLPLADTEALNAVSPPSAATAPQALEASEEETQA